jgi:hypothetical protein
VGLVRLLAAKDESTALSLNDDDLALRCFVEKAEPLPARF